MTTKPTRIGKYEILGELGRGGFATVYKARDLALERVVALKVLHAHWAQDKQFVDRFRQEARAAARLCHPHIVTVYEAGEAGDQLYIAMEYLPGRTLQASLEAEGALPLERALPILEQVAEALDHAHAQGMVHRDVKPGNVMVEQAEEVRATLTDFGLVKALAASTALTSHGTLLGSPEYMAPEQADPERAGEVGAAADRYALGVVAYQMLTGRVPFPGNTPATLYAHEHKPVPPPRSLRRGLSQAVEAALLRMLAKAPAGRFPSAGAFVAQLREALLAERQAVRLAPLYGELQAAAARQEWAEVLALGGRIQELNPAYRDVPEWMARARDHLRRPPRRRPRGRGRPAWLWPVVGGTAALLVVIGIAVVVVPRLIGMLLPPMGAPVMPEGYTGAPPPAEADIGDTWTRPADGMVMVYVPAGEFLMGSSDADGQAGDDEKPQHTVYLDAYWIDRAEVTNAQYRKCVEAGACQQPGCWEDEDYNAPDQPVVCVSWDDVQAYAAWAGGRLPTEAEWEKAARGTDGRIYPWGYKFDGTRLNYCDRNCGFDWKDTGADDGYALVAPVGSYPSGASPYGALDMAGNVWEWVADWYDAEYYGHSPARNPQGPDAGDRRVLRGGAFSNGVGFVRRAARDWNFPNIWNWDLGFRLVVSRAPG